MEMEAELDSLRSSGGGGASTRLARKAPKPLSQLAELELGAFLG